MEQVGPISKTFLNLKELTISIIQGLVITIGTLYSYIYAVCQGYNEDLTRTMVFTTLVVANVFLTLVNRSFHYSILTTWRYKNDLIVYVIFISIALLLAMIYVPLFAAFFKLSPLSLSQFGLSILVGFMSVIWFEGYKWVKILRGSFTETRRSYQVNR